MTPRLLDRYLWRQLRDVLAFGVAIFTTLLLINHLFFVGRLVLQQEAPLSVAVQLVVFRLPYFVGFSLPMGMLLAALLTTGRLSDGQEITAMRTSGISLSRIAASVVAAGVVVSVANLALNELLVPSAEDRYRQALAVALRRPAPAAQRDVLFRDVQEGVESVYFVRRFLRDEQKMEGVVVNQLERGTLRRVIEAPEARYVGDGWEFRDGAMYVLTGEGTVVTRFQRLRVGLRRTPREIAVPAVDPSEMSIRELRRYADVIRRGGGDPTRYVVQAHFKTAVPFSAALFALLAVPLGLRPHRSGTSIGLGLTILVLIGYYIVSSITLTLGENGRLPPLPAAWAPNVVLGASGVVLLWRADR